VWRDDVRVLWSYGVLESFGLGFLAQSSLLLAGLFVCWVAVPKHIVGILGGFGAGLLIGAVCFDLIPEAKTLSDWEIAVWMLVGAAIFIGGDIAVDRRFGSSGSSEALGIVVGSVVDGVPESLIFGIQIATGFPVSAGFLAAVWVSNIPQAFAPSADLHAAGWSTRRLGLLWIEVVLACGLAAVVGYILANNLSVAAGDAVAALAAGGILTMLTTSLMPFSWERGGYLAGAATAAGFAFSLLTS
jgi:zinc transporter, ZIP family